MKKRLVCPSKKHCQDYYFKNCNGYMDNKSFCKDEIDKKDWKEMVDRLSKDKRRMK